MTSHDKTQHITKLQTLRRTVLLAVRDGHLFGFHVHKMVVD